MRLINTIPGTMDIQAFRIYYDTYYEQLCCFLNFYTHDVAVIEDQACMNGHKVAYYNLYRLFEEIALARISSTLHRFFAKLA